MEGQQRVGEPARERWASDEHLQERTDFAVLDFRASIGSMDGGKGEPVQRWFRIVGCAAVAAALGAGAARAEDGYTFTASLAGGFAGAFDVQAERDFDHPALQASFGMFTAERTLTMVRVGRFDLDSDRPFAGRLEAELDYANVAGEYRFRQAAYDFGLFVGLGGYQLQGAGRDDETALGLALGFTGDFDLTRRLSVVAEVDAHYVFFDDANFYGAALVGLAVHF